MAANYQIYTDNFHIPYPLPSDRDRYRRVQVQGFIMPMGIACLVYYLHSSGQLFNPNFKRTKCQCVFLQVVFQRGDQSQPSVQVGFDRRQP